MSGVSRFTHSCRSALFAGVALSVLLIAGCDSLTVPTLESELQSSDVLRSGGPGHVDVIVQLQPGLASGQHAANRDRAAAMAQELGFEAVHTYGTALFGFSASVPEAQLAALRANPNVHSVEMDRPVSLPPIIMDADDEGPIDVHATQVYPWGITRTGADKRPGAGGEGIHVYVLDTGIDSSHPDLLGALGEGHTVFTSTCKGNPRNCPPPPTWEDDNGHGTHVAGTIGGRDNGFGVLGVAPKVTMHAVKVLSSGGSGSRSGVIAGVDWVAEQTAVLGRPTVANMSLGGGGLKAGTCTAEGLMGSDDAYHAALCNATNQGVVFVVSAGNAGRDAAEYAPAAYYDAAITVSATGCRNIVNRDVETCDPGSEYFTAWSNWGSRSDGAFASEGSLPVAIAAPGRSVFSTYPNNEYRRMSGTSMAAPHVAGAAALILERGAVTAPDGSAFLAVRAALMGETECTSTWWNDSGNPHDERFLNVRGDGPIVGCVAAGTPPLASPKDFEATKITSSSVSIAWAHANDYAYTDRFYELQNYDGIAWEHLGFLPDELTTYVHDGLRPATHYRYALRAVRMADESIIEASAWIYLNVQTLEDEDGLALEASFHYDCGNSATCRFESTSSGSDLVHTWDFGDGNEGTGPTVSHTYTEQGGRTVTLVVTDGQQRDFTRAWIRCELRGNRLRCQ